MAYIEFIKPPIPAGFQASGDITSTSGGLFALTIPTGACYAIVKAITQPLRFRDDGTNPTSMIGRSLAANDVIELTSRKQMADFKLIAQGTSGAAEILYYKLTE